jgi:hypothetical protein
MSNNEFDFKGYLKNNPLLKETNINVNESQLRERVRAEILSALKENTMLMRDPSVSQKVMQIIKMLMQIDVDGETMEFILKQVGMEDQMQHQLTSGGIQEQDNDGEFNKTKPARIKEFIIALNRLVDEYHAELYLNDGLFDAISMVIKYAQEEAMNINEAEEKDQPEEEETPEVADVEPEITGDKKIVQDALTQAYEAANKIGDKKLLDQIGNTITFFTRSHIVSNK